MRPVAACAILLGAVALLAGCGRSADDERRDAVNAYFRQVNAAEERLLSQTGDIDATFRTFTLRPKGPTELRRLQRAKTRIEGALARVRALDPPSDAASLQTGLLRLLAAQASVANELVWALRYVPRLDRALAPLGPAGVALGHDLTSVGSGSKPTARSGALEPFAAAFARYERSLRLTVARADRLSAPPILRPGLVAERNVLHRSVALSHEIVAALGRRDVKAANTGIHALFTISAEASDLSVRKAQAATAKAYDARLTRIAVLERNVAAARAKLVKELG